MKVFSPEQTLSIILFVTLATGLLGIYIENNTTPSISLILFITYGAIYFTIAGYFDDEKIKIKENV